jgi:alkylation response protein AidB-like acyl-CoA dehydrogenase
LLDMTVEYAKDREQFGVPIGSFQAVKHRLADVAVQVDAARELVLYAADVVDGGDPAELPALVAATKAAVSDAYVRAGAEAIQLHGGIGFTWEHDAHLFYKRALVSARLLGTAVDQCDRLAELLGV